MKDNQPWIRKHCPKKVEDVISQQGVISSLKGYISNYDKQKKRAILLYGPSGCGKTSSVYTVAEEADKEILEINASDFRNKAQIESVVGAASRQMSLFGKGKLILVDELDGISGKKDFGGVAALVKMMADSGWPVVITANNPFDKKFSSIRNKSEMLQYKGLSTSDVLEILKKICEKESLKYDERVLKVLAMKSAGDARGAVNDLQIMAAGGDTIDESSIENMSARDKLDTMLSALTLVLKTTDANSARNAFDTVQEDFNERFLWLDENIPKEYTKPADLERAYDKLAKADVYMRRIRRWQHWRYLVYVNDLISAGVAVSKDKRNKDFVQYKPTGRILKLWWAKQKSMKKKAVAQKIAEKTHAGSRDILQDIELYKLIFKDKDLAAEMTEELDLNQDEVAFLKR